MGDRLTPAPKVTQPGTPLVAEARSFLDILVGEGSANDGADASDDASGAVGAGPEQEYRDRRAAIERDADTLNELYMSVSDIDGVEDGWDMLQELNAFAQSENWADALKKLDQFEPLLAQVMQAHATALAQPADDFFGDLPPDEAPTTNTAPDWGASAKVWIESGRPDEAVEDLAVSDQYYPELIAQLKDEFKQRRADPDKIAQNEKETKASIDGLVNTLQTSPELLTKPGDDLGPWDEATKQLTSIQPEADFYSEYHLLSMEAAHNIAADPLVQEAHKNWDQWTADPDALKTNAKKIQSFMQRVLETQSATCFPDCKPGKVKLSWSRPTEAGATWAPDLPPDPNVPEGVHRFQQPEDEVVPEPENEEFKKTPELEAALDEAAQLDQDNDPDRSTIEVNLNNAACIQDFREVMNTLTHENTHAYQNGLILRFRSGDLQPGDRDYNAAMAFSASNALYLPSHVNERITRPGEDEAGNIEIYKQQAMEKHAFRAGDNTSQWVVRDLERQSAAASSQPAEEKQ